MRRMLLVPMFAGASERGQRRRDVARAGRLAARRRRADPRAAASPRSSSPSGRSAGMSLALWTATSTVSSSSASSISLTNSRLLADLRHRRRLQPVAGRLDDRPARRRCPWLPGAPPPSAPATAPAGCRASRCEAASASVAPERRHAGLSRRFGGRLLGAEPEQPVQRVRIGEIRFSSRDVFSCSVGVSSSFCTSSCVISSTRARASGGRPASFGSSRAQLRLPDGFEAIAQRDHRRDDRHATAARR